MRAMQKVISKKFKEAERKEKSKIWHAARRLTRQEEIFCVAYVRCGIGRKAAIEAFDGVTEQSTGVESRVTRLLSSPRVKARIKVLRNQIAKKSLFGVQNVFNHWVAIATADPNTLIQHRRTCCRFCYGVEHNYQWVKSEFVDKAAEQMSKGKAPPACLGGFGFNATLDPLPSCPSCYGEGIGNVFAADTRKLSVEERLLFGGVKQKRGGEIEIVLRNQDAALENIAKFLGMFKNTVELTGKDGGPLTSVEAIAAVTDPVEASKIYQKIMGEG